jgi:hypothetical protein
VSNGPWYTLNILPTYKIVRLGEVSRVEDLMTSIVILVSIKKKIVETEELYSRPKSKHLETSIQL